MAEVDVFIGNVMSGVVLAFQVVFGTVHAALQFAFGGVKW